MMQNTLGMLRMFQWRWHEAGEAYGRAIAVEPRNAYRRLFRLSNLHKLLRLMGFGFQAGGNSRKDLVAAPEIHV